MFNGFHTLTSNPHISYFLCQVLVPKRSEFKGKMIEVEIFEAGKHFLKGRPLDGSEVFTPSIAEPLQKGEVSGLTQVTYSIRLCLCPSVNYW